MNAWHESRLKTASIRFPIGSSWCSWRRTARELASGSAITVERENDKDGVVALREIAERTISPDDMRERLIHSMQEQVELDEPEAAAAPMRPQETRPALGRDDPAIDTNVDTMTEEALLYGLKKMLPDDPSKQG
jgi:DNA-directed RNA polymerase subunit omega